MGRLAFKGWTFRSPTSYDDEYADLDSDVVPHIEPTASARYADSQDLELEREHGPGERGYASEGETLGLARRVGAMVDEVVLEDDVDDDPDYEPYPRPHHENRCYASFGRNYPDPALPPRPRVKSENVTHALEPTFDSGYGTDASHDEMYGSRLAGKVVAGRYRSYSFDRAREFDPEFDRGAELVKWQEIVTDSVAAESALAAAAATAVQHKRICELDGSDTPSEETPRASDATARPAHRRLRISLRSRVSPVVVI